MSSRTELRAALVLLDLPTDFLATHGRMPVARDQVTGLLEAVHRLATVARSKGWPVLALEYPIATALGLLFVAGLFRLIDIFVLRLDERWGEIVVSKIAGVVLLLGFLAATDAGLAASGFHMQAVAPSLLLGAGLTIAALLAGYSVEFTLHAQGGQGPAIKVLAIDPKSSLVGAAGFALLLLVGNFINSFAEEGLF